MNKKFFCAALLGFSGFANAASESTPIYRVENTEGNFIQVSLTQDIYRYSLQPDLRDLTVLDAENNPLPYRILSANPQPQAAEPKIITTSLPFFPVAVDATPDTLRKLHTQAVNIQGRQVQIATSDKILDNKTPEFYLIDLSKLDHDITSMVVDWASGPGNEYLEVQLEATENLHDWSSLASATLVQITQQEQSLKRNHVDVSIAKNDYQFLRLRILRGADNLQITQISAEEKIGAPAKSVAKKETWSVAGPAAKDQNTVHFESSRSKTHPVAAWEFTREEVTPAEKLAVNLGNSNYAAGIKIFSRKTETQVWQLQYQGIMFNVQVGNEWQKSDPISLYHNSEKFWRIELDETMRAAASPQLVFGWQPLDVQFIGNAKPPFYLAISRDNNNSDYRDQVFSQITSVTKPEWKHANLQLLKVETSRLNTSAQINWKQTLFWVVLIFAVLVLMIFAFRLFKQMNRQAGNN